jgi:uncharacterized SAM-binding protein YcdF (DUF218 family)
MFFILSKIIDFLFSPLNWIIALFLIALISKNEIRKKKFLKLGVFSLLFFTNPFISNLSLLLIPSTENQILLNKNKKAAIALVLGGMISYDDSKKQVTFNSNVNRITKAVELYKNKKVKTIFISGGSGSVTYSEKREATLLKNYLIKYFNIPNKDILIENKSNNTYENAKFTAEILKKEKLIKKKIILITSNTHYYRAQKCFEKQGIKTFILNEKRTKTREKWMPKNLFLPQSDILFVWDNLLHEIIGVITYKCMGYI